MQKSAASYLLSASDLVGHLGCRRLTELNRAVADGRLGKPASYPDPMLDALIERGRIHEAAFVEQSKSQGLNVVDLNALNQVGISEEAVAATRAAMKAGADIIVQAALRTGLWGGRADVLRRVERPSQAPSQFGAYSYQAIDTKLARETKAGAVLQLSLYSDLLADAQGVGPEFAHVVTPGEPFNEASFRVDDFAAYYRRVKRELELSLARAPSEIYPEPVPHCEICRWFKACDSRRRGDDHLSFVAGLAKSHAVELGERGVATLQALAATPVPLTWKPARGAVETYEKLREQARVQFEARVAGKPVHEVLAPLPGFGLALLPEPNAGDIFLDLEGDGFVPPAGLEYLFGYVYRDDNGALVCRGDWALTPEQEKTAFEGFIDFAAARLAQYPDLHIYHYAPYEPSAFKRLMGRYATREEELDGLLRSGRFVDLYSVVRHGVRCSVESYSIKKLEIFYGFKRSAALPEVNHSLARLQAALELGQPVHAFNDDRILVQRYNEDDCRSTLALRDWLETLRAEQIQAGISIERPTPKAPEAPDNISQREQAAAALALALSVGVPVDASDRTPEQNGRWLLAQSLNWHRREQKAVWWEYFRLADLSAEDLIDERAALSGLSFEKVITPGDSPVHRYRFPPQETDLRGGEDLRSVGGDRLGAVDAVALDEGWVDIKKQKAAAGVHPEAVFGFDYVPTDVLADALMRIGADAVANQLGTSSAFPAARDLLIRAAPNAQNCALVNVGETTRDAAIRLGLNLASGALPIQGPPGTGKTFTGAQMICALVKAGKTVGITANSHSVIVHLLEETIKVAGKGGLALSCIHRGPVPAAAPPGLRFMSDNARALKAISADAQVAGGTAWFWARPDAANSVDVLFIDEAAQMSLANVLAVSHAAPTLVLLGDPQQLEQPMKGVHPEGVNVSALDHVLDGAKTIGADRGLFLAETWRLNPAICRFTSELFYEGRLQARPNLERQEIKSTGRLQGAGLRCLLVPHAGNTNVSLEEVDAVGTLVDDILGSNTSWIDADGLAHAVTLDDILIVAPYNAQVFALQQRLPNARIGTVDKFQGQEKPIVIYSMTTSSSAEAPRGMEFLFSLNRLNVATSRARCICVLVAAPALFGAECKSPRQMQLANALCRYRELASNL